MVRRAYQWGVSFVSLLVSADVFDKTLLVDTPVCEFVDLIGFRTSGRALEVSPALRGDRSAPTMHFTSDVAQYFSIS